MNPQPVEAVRLWFSDGDVVVALYDLQRLGRIETYEYRWSPSTTWRNMSLGTKVLVVLIGIVVISGTALALWAANERKLAATRDEEASQRRHKEAQEAYRTQLAECRETALSLFESLPVHLQAAEDCLLQADRDFAEDAFEPFWVSIEEAANALGGFYAAASGIDQASSRYGALVGPIRFFV